MTDFFKTDAGTPRIAVHEPDPSQTLITVLPQALSAKEWGFKPHVLVLIRLQTDNDVRDGRGSGYNNCYSRLASTRHLTCHSVSSNRPLSEQSYQENCMPHNDGYDHNLPYKWQTVEPFEQ